MITSDRINVNINAENRINKLNLKLQALLESDFSDWSGKERIESNFSRLTEKMIAAYNRCGGGQNNDDDGEDDKAGKGTVILGLTMFD